MLSMVLTELRTLVRRFGGLLGLPSRTRLSAQLEMLALRHQLTVYQRSEVGPHIEPANRLLWAWLSGIWSG